MATTYKNVSVDNWELCLDFASRRNSLKAGAWAVEFFGVQTFGVECVDAQQIGRRLYYVNLGDTYDITLCREGSEFFLSSWGDWLEQAEAQHEQETGERRCAWCGQFSEDNETCDHCGHAVDG